MERYYIDDVSEIHVAHLISSTSRAISSFARIVNGGVLFLVEIEMVRHEEAVAGCR